MSKVEKKEGAKMTCGKCGIELVCHMSEYDGFENKLQWQNSDGTAHYKWTGPGKFDCVMQADIASVATTAGDAPVQMLGIPNEINEKLDEIVKVLTVHTDVLQQILQIVADSKLEEQYPQEGSVEEEHTI